MRNIEDKIDDQPMEIQRHFGQAIGDVSRAWRYEMNLLLKPFGLNLSQRQVLVQLHRHPDGLMQTDLARKLGIESPTLARLLDLLEKKEWIRRITSPDDHRRKYSTLTPKAMGQIFIIEKISRQLLDRMMVGIAVDEVEAGFSVMEKIRRNLLEE